MPHFSLEHHTDYYRLSLNCPINNFRLVSVYLYKKCRLFVCLLDTALCFYLMFQFLTVLHELHFLLTWFQYLNAANVFLFSLFTKVHPSSNALCCSMMKLNPLYHSIDVFCTSFKQSHFHIAFISSNVIPFSF